MASVNTNKHNEINKEIEDRLKNIEDRLNKMSEALLIQGELIKQLSNDSYSIRNSLDSISCTVNNMRWGINRY